MTTVPFSFYRDVVERSTSLPGTTRTTPPEEPLDDIID